MAFETPADIVSYMIGRQVGDQLKTSQFPGFDLDGLFLGIKDALGNVEMPISQEKIQEAYDVIQTELQKSKAAAETKCKEDGASFLAENAKKEGVAVTESGLQYEVITEGSGEKPSRESTVRTHYHGTFIDGRVFDSSVDRGQPAEFPVGGVIAGWTEALQLMSVGSKWRLTIPYNLAYGEQGSQGAIPPFSALVFEVELIAII